MKVKEFIEKYHDKYSEYYIAIYIWGHHDNLAPDYSGEFSRKFDYMKYWDYEIEGINQTSTRINLFLKEKDTKLIKIKVNDKDREILSRMFSYAIKLTYQCEIEASTQMDKNHWKVLAAKMKEVRDRVVYEELEDESKNTCETE